MTDQAQPLSRAEKRQARRLKRFDNPWLNPKLIWGMGILIFIVLMGLLGQWIWNTELVFTGSTPLRLPPLGFENLRGTPGVSEFPLGTDGAGRDLLALLIVGTPNTLMIGAIASSPKALNVGGLAGKDWSRLTRRLKVRFYYCFSFLDVVPCFFDSNPGKRMPLILCIFFVIYMKILKI